MFLSRPVSRVFDVSGNAQIDIRDRDDNKEVSLSTSKINYMDPRVSVAWCKRHEVPVEKVSAWDFPAYFTRRPCAFGVARRLS